MKLTFMALILGFNMSLLNAGDSPEWKCSGRIKLDFVNKTAINKKGIWIHGGAVQVDLIFDIDSIDSIYVFPVKFKTRKKQISCQHKNIRKAARFYLKFFRPFNGHKLRAEIKPAPEQYIVDGKVTYLFVVAKIIKGKKIFYFRNFTFNISQP